MIRTATAIAHANIALVKYWGKRDPALNLPAAGSLSLTLAALTTTTTVAFDPSLKCDALILDGKGASEKECRQLSAWLDLVRPLAGSSDFARVESANNFPTASGLASSASGYAALALAASSALGLALGSRELSILARRGSGSAARSIFGGLVRMHQGVSDDGSDAYAEPLDGSALGDDLRMVIAVVGGGVRKAHSSRDAMDHCAETSPLYKAWLDAVAADLPAAERAIATGDLAALGAITEGSAMAMHATAMASRPPIVYFQPQTLACLAALAELRASSLHAYPTMDAGPHVKVLTTARDAAAVVRTLTAVPGVSEVIVSEVGGAARLVEHGD